MFRTGDKIIFIKEFETENLNDFFHYLNSCFTLGKVYEVLEINSKSFHIQIDNSTDRYGFIFDDKINLCFITLKEYRKQKINKICLKT